jgi:hypothetical protein
VPNCYNCGDPLTGAYCATCGQKAEPLDLTLPDFLHELGHEFLQVDGKILASVRQLFLVPGFLTREQFLGRRVRWVSPLRLYLLLSVLYFGIVSLSGPGVLKLTVKNAPGSDASAEIQRFGFRSEQEFHDAVNLARVTWLPRAMFLLVPFLAWLVRVAYRDAGKSYLQHLYFALHLQAAWFGAAAVAALPGLIDSRIASALTQLLPVYALLYAVPALRRAYGGSKAQAWGRGIVIVGVYGAATILVTLAIVLPVVFGRVAHL